jgi:hypothetical protein
VEKTEQYRQFAETLTVAAQAAQDSAREMLLAAAATWRALADEIEPAFETSAEVVNFAEARQRLLKIA